MDQTKPLTFQVFRYQLLPINQLFQGQFEPKISSVEELKQKKNQYFSQVLHDIKTFDYSRTELVHKIEVHTEKSICFRIGAKRKIKRRTKDFKEEEIENWPNVLILINNDPTVQKIAIQENRNVFEHIETVREILEKNINHWLSAYQLKIFIEPTYEINQFWDIIEKNTNKILSVEFELISPNMANISGKLELDLSSLAKQTNTQKTNLALNSDKHSALTITRDNKFVSSLAEYSSEGGGDVVFKIRGYKKKVRTAKKVIEISCEEMELHGKKDICEFIHEKLK
jgi:hypothetical protein